MRISDWSSDVCSSDLRKARSATRNGTNAGIWRPSPLGAPDFSRNASREYMDIVAVDIGGTNARFAIARVEAGRVLKLGPPLTLKTNAHVGLSEAWAVFAASTAQHLPRTAALAVAAPVEGGVVTLPNSSWVLRPSHISQPLGLVKRI